MKVLVTGGLGFLGSATCELGAKYGDEIVVLDNFTNYELEASGYKTNKSKQYVYDYLKKLGIDVLRGDLSKFDEEDYKRAREDEV